MRKTAPPAEKAVRRVHMGGSAPKSRAQSIADVHMGAPLQGQVGPRRLSGREQQKRPGVGWGVRPPTHTAVPGA